MESQQGQVECVVNTESSPPPALAVRLWYTDPTDDEDPPEYCSLDINSGETPPLDYETVMAATSTGIPPPDIDLTKGSLIADAPPSYRQLFGTEEDSSTTNSVNPRQTRRWRRSTRPHTLRRRQQSTQNDEIINHTQNQSIMNKLLSCIPNVTLKMHLFVTISLALMAIPLSMLTVGIMNINVCSRTIIPLYLIIAGFCLLAEVIVHMITFLVSEFINHESSLYTLQFCDRLAFLMLIWVLIGSNWIFKVSLYPTPCATGANLQSNNISRDEHCENCSIAVYHFTSVVIVAQYLLAFTVLTLCCFMAIRNMRLR